MGRTGRVGVDKSDSPGVTSAGMTPPLKDSRTLFRTTELAVMLRVNPRTVRRWIAEGHITVITTPGGHQRIPASEVERLTREGRPQ